MEESVTITLAYPAKRCLDQMRLYQNRSMSEEQGRLRADDYQGYARIIVDEDHQVLLGATFIGHEIGDLLHAATVAIVGQVPLEKLFQAIPSFPTVNEVWIRLLELHGC